MYVTYFDEVKADRRVGRDHYFVGGISLPMASIPAIEGRVNELAEEQFGSVELSPKTEFHASNIYFGKNAFKGRPPDERIEVLGKLATILAEANDVRRIYAAIDTSKLKDTRRAGEFAFAHFCERVQMSLSHGETSILIGDNDDEHVRGMVRDFARYRAQGTPWQYGIEIKSIVDTVHFSQSHHCRMIQLADAYIFFQSHGWGGRSGRMADALTKALAGKDLHANRYKIWPNR